MFGLDNAFLGKWGWSHLFYCSLFSSILGFYTLDVSSTRLRSRQSQMSPVDTASSSWGQNHPGWEPPSQYLGNYKHIRRREVIFPRNISIGLISKWWKFWACPQTSVCVCEVAQSCPALCDPMDCSPPGSSVHGILQARILEWVAISFSRGSSQQTCRSYFGVWGRCKKSFLMFLEVYVFHLSNYKANIVADINIM